MYKNGTEINMKKDQLIQAYKNGEIDMDDDGLVVHFGGIDAAAADVDALEEEEWDAAIDHALDGWADLCANDCVIYTGSL